MLCKHITTRCENRERGEKKMEKEVEAMKL